MMYYVYIVAFGIYTTKHNIQRLRRRKKNNNNEMIRMPQFWHLCTLGYRSRSSLVFAFMVGTFYDICFYFRMNILIVTVCFYFIFIYLFF